MNPLLAKAEALSRAGVFLLAVALLLGAYQFGRHVKTGEVAEAQRKQANEIARLKDERQAKADELALANAARRTESAPRERLITKEVTRYVQVTNPADRCRLPGTWRLRHDAAASGVPLPADPGPVAAGTAPPVEDAAALETVGDNYEQCREWREQVLGWQEFWQRVKGTGDAVQ